MSDQFDKDLALLQRATPGRWQTDCSQRLSVAVPHPEDPETTTLYEVGEMYCDADAAMVVAMGNHGAAYVEAIRELESVVTVQLEQALNPDIGEEERRRVLKNCYNFVIGIIRRTIHMAQ